MANRFLIIASIVATSFISLTSCVNVSNDHPEGSNKVTTVNPNFDPTFNPNSTIAGNNSFITTDGTVTLLDSATFVVFTATNGRCDCDTVALCNYYIVSGNFAKGDSLKASFNAYFNKRPVVSRNYTIIPFVSDTTNHLVYTLNDTTAFLKVTDISRTRKTWGGVKGGIQVEVTNNIPRVSFNAITGKNLSNLSDTTIISGFIQCKVNN